jgi:cytochrome subunit of sulfide dehydrogenase
MKIVFGTTDIPSESGNQPIRRPANLATLAIEPDLQLPEHTTMHTRPPIRPRLAVAAALLSIGSAAVAQTAALLNTRALAATCASCHGTDGKAVAGEAMVAIAGLPRAYIVTQLQAFRDGSRPATVMHQIAKGYTGEQIEALAAYFATVK